MRISNIQTNTNNKRNISHKGAREFVRTLANPDALTSTVLLESAVTGGRGYNAYKRGGVNELRERATDDILAAVFWMKGVDIFNKIGDKLIGQRILKLPTTEFDMGRDALRTPFKNTVESLKQQGIKADDLAKLEKKLATYKFAKIIGASLVSTAFVGFALPKINQAITRMFMSKDKKEAQKSEKNQNSQGMINKGVATAAVAQLASVSFEEFSKKIAGKENVSFKGLFSPETMSTVVHYLENNKICKLLTSDVGITTGRVASARNADEGLEYLFRDVASSFFYVASTPLIYKGLQKLTSSEGITSIDPVASKQVHHKLSSLLKNVDGMDVQEFARRAVGSLDDGAKAIMDKIPFVDDVISLENLKKYVKDENIIKKATDMAKLQPKQAGVGAVLTKQQVADSFRTGIITDPRFMKTMYRSHFGDALTNKSKFIPMKKITTFRSNIDDYVNSIIKAANKTSDKRVTKEILDKVNKKGFGMSAGFRAVAIGISALALGVAIPKIQYAITAKRTGSNAAPGLREFEENKEQTTVKSTTA